MRLVLFDIDGTLLNSQGLGKASMKNALMNVFGAPGDGSYRMRPIFVDDMAKLAVELGLRGDDVTVDAIGPETFTFDEWLRLLAKTVGRRARIVHLPPTLALWAWTSTCSR